MGTVGAFFDFDRTLIDVDSPSLGIRYLWEKGLISLPYIIKVMAFNVFYQRHLISDDVMARVLISFYRNKPFAPFDAGSVEYYEEVIKPHLAPNIVECVKVHKDQGHTLVLISAGLRYLLKPVASDLGFDHLVCTDLEVRPDGILTGRTVGPICTDSHKRDLAKKLTDASRYGPRSILCLRQPPIRHPDAGARGPPACRGAHGAAQEDGNGAVSHSEFPVVDSP